MATETVFEFWDMFMLIFVIMTVVPLFYRGIRPSRRIHTLLATLEELDGLYYYSLESGFMSDLAATTLRGQVHALHARTDVLRFRAMKATTFRGELKNWSSGLSGEISEAIRDVKALRGKISAMSLVVLEARQRQPMCFDCDIKTAVPPSLDIPAIVVAEYIDPVDMPAEIKHETVAL
ncbi:hypothetical protein C8T65DRAFT_657006 [Cerioporus squamosus]|nr:hypothetical protein C8T65DRAFT_657006 [Cerioporus squamosus]